MIESTDIQDTNSRYINLFHKNQAMITRDDPLFLQEMREQGIEQFKSSGFPKKKEENYRYTHLEPVFNDQLSHFFEPRNIEFDVKELFHCDVPSLDTNVLMVLNGFFLSNGEGKLRELDNGVIYGSLMEASKKHPDLVKKYIGKNADSEKESFVALNSAFSQDGVFLYVPDNQQMEHPIQIIHLLLSDTNQMVHHRNLFIAGKNSHAEVIICDHTLSPHMFLTNSVTEVFTDENADFDLIRLQNEHNNSCQVTNTWIRQERDSRCRHNSITLHGGMVRNNLNVKLSGVGAHIDALGLFLLDKQQHVDNFTVIEHEAPHCTSNQHYKGVLDDVATGVFSGKIIVDRDAQKTEAYQTNNNILLADTAKMHTKPTLVINADDVKCSHGATVGQIDEEALFYLQSRGISRDESKLLLMYAFANDVISKIKEASLRDRISDLVNKRLRGELSRCNNCAMHCNE